MKLKEYWNKPILQQKHFWTVFGPIISALVGAVDLGMLLTTPEQARVFPDVVSSVPDLPDVIDTVAELPDPVTSPVDYHVPAAPY